MIEEVLAAREDFTRQRPLLSPEALREKESEITRMEAELYQFEQEKFGPEGEAVRRDMELSEPIYEKIRSILKEVAEEDEYDLIFDVSGAVLYVKPSLNMDERVQEALKAQG
jgi:outer membrane protein